MHDSQIQEHREVTDEFLGDPREADPTSRPVKDDQVCDRCRHPRWMHGGAKMQGPCHSTVWKRKVPHTSLCVYFVEETDV